MHTGDLNLACATALVDELVVHGLRHACVSPGSRSTALALAMARHADVEVHVHLDERSSAFFAVGLAKGLHAAVAVVCTSGTAAVELYPAVVEASQARVPLYMLTADRPPRLRGTGANQTIDQARLFGTYARAYLEPPVPTTPADTIAWRHAGRDAVAASAWDTPGPVHVNCSFDEPLVPTGAVVEVVEVSPREPGRAEHPDRNRDPLAGDVERAARALSGARGVVVAGSSWWASPDHVPQLAERLGWPVVAEPVSGIRRPGRALAAGQALIGSQGFLDRHRPEVVLQVGATPTTRATQALVATAERLVVIDRFHMEPDPERRASWRLRADPDRLAEELLLRRIDPAPHGWLSAWLELDARARGAMDGALDAFDEPSELRLARDLAAAVPEGGTLFVGNSMPIRDLDHAMAPREKLRVLANRGASGIDGLVSTALGIAAAKTGPTFALIGDLSLLYDVGALLWNPGRPRADVVFVVPNNGGGSIFRLLDQRDLPERDDLFVTPHGIDLGSVCAAAGIGHQAVERMASLPSALGAATAAGGIRVVEVAVDPDRDRVRRDVVRTAVDAALAVG